MSAHSENNELLNENIDEERINQVKTYDESLLNEQQYHQQEEQDDDDTHQSGFIVSKQTAVLFTTNEGIYLRRFTGNKTVTKSTERQQTQSNNYSIEFCDLTKWSRSSHVETIGLSGDSSRQSTSTITGTATTNNRNNDNKNKNSSQVSRKTTTTIGLNFFKKMHSRLLILVWRRKLLFLGCSVFFLLLLWCWAIYYSTNAASSSVYGSTLLSSTSSQQLYGHHDDSNKIISVKELDSGGRHDALLRKLGIYNFSRKSKIQNNNGNNVDGSGVKFVRPTGYHMNKDIFDKLDPILLNKQSSKYLQNLEMPTRDEIVRRKIAEQLRYAAEKQTNYEHELQRMGIPIVAGLGPGGPTPPGHRLVHLDLKGAPPKISYLKRLLPILKSLGATGLLIEYEDMFPYTGTIANLSAKNSYTKNELRSLLKTASTLDLIVIPLIQTFGHMEFALKLREYQHLREVDESPQSVCPSLNSSMILIEEMITQIMDFHTDGNNEIKKSKRSVGAGVAAGTSTTISNKLSLGTVTSTPTTTTTTNDATRYTNLPKLTHVHIGCDEVYRIAECPRCHAKSKHELFIGHVQGVAELVKRRWPHIRLIIWDDMLRQIPMAYLQETKIGKLVEPMVWAYANNIYDFISSQTWDKYATIFPTAWAASAFKGAFGETLLIPPVRSHLENTLHWLAVIGSESARFTNGIQGLALTGWQRYDHFAVLCELLPTSLPSLAICLSTAARGYFELNPKNNIIMSALSCPSDGSMEQWMDLGHDPNMATFTRCMFPGFTLYRFIHHLSPLTLETREFLDSVKYKQGWLTDYNIRHNFSSPSRIKELIAEAVLLQSSLTYFSRRAVNVMNDIYDKATIGEFIEQKIFPLINELRILEKNGNIIKSRKIWPRRPIPYTKELDILNLTSEETKTNKGNSIE